jgi:hypothetical protein
VITESLRRAFGASDFSVKEARAVLGIEPASTLHRLKAAGVLESRGKGRYAFTRGDAPLRILAHLDREVITTTRATRLRDLADLALRRWVAWQQSGFVEPIAPRRYKLNPSDSGGRLAIRRK